MADKPKKKPRTRLARTQRAKRTPTNLQPAASTPHAPKSSEANIALDNLLGDFSEQTGALFG